MKRDIRDLFKEDDHSGNLLPDHHREEFYKKLKASRPRHRSKIRSSYLLKAAAIIILFMALSLVIFNRVENIEQQIADETPVESQINEIEQIYLTSIEEEWKNFVDVAKDERLINRYERKLDELDERYQELSLKFKEDSNNILVVEALVDNLKTRLQLLKDIQTHIKIINQTYEQHENTF